MIPYQLIDDHVKALMGDRYEYWVWDNDTETVYIRLPPEPVDKVTLNIVKVTE